VCTRQAGEHLDVRQHVNAQYDFFPYPSLQALQLWKCSDNGRAVKMLLRPKPVTPVPVVLEQVVSSHIVDTFTYSSFFNHRANITGTMANSRVIFLAVFASFGMWAGHFETFKSLYGAL